MVSFLSTVGRLQGAQAVQKVAQRAVSGAALRGRRLSTVTAAATAAKGVDLIALATQERTEFTRGGLYTTGVSVPRNLDVYKLYCLFIFIFCV